MKRRTQITILLVVVILSFVALIGHYLISSSKVTLNINNVIKEKNEQNVSENEEEIHEKTNSEPLDFAPINLNDATEVQLIQIPGIGEILAERIVDYRDENGSFKDISELTNVDGISEGKLESIKKHIFTEEKTAP